MNPRAFESRAADAPWDAVLVLPFGRLGVRCNAQRLLRTEYLTASAMPATPPEPSTDRAPLLRELLRQLQAYCRDARFIPDLPLATSGSEFQRRVQEALREIPAGRTRSYGDLARELGSAPRAVGQACGANPFAPLVPCHRVLGAAGLGGFAHSTEVGGELLGIKRWLLRHEGAMPLLDRDLRDRSAPDRPPEGDEPTGGSLFDA